MYPQSAFVTSTRDILALPQTAARSAESVLVAKSPTPFFFIAAALFLPAAFIALLLWLPFGRLPPGYFTTFFFFFFFLAFFFFFFAFFFFGFFAFFVGFFAAFFFAGFFFADVCCVRARVALVISFFTCGRRRNMHKETRHHQTLLTKYRPVSSASGYCGSARESTC